MDTHDSDKTLPDSSSLDASTRASKGTPLTVPKNSFIGPYRVLELLGSGGMGEVYLAEQLTPIHRRVALKIIKQGMDTKDVVARFETERQALALMDHAAIAKVFEAGATPRGRPYFAMEYVQGASIIEYCDTHRLSIDERVRLFVKVCEGVQHAHQCAIIHRDLKPSNILVSVHGQSVSPKIIDFGVAKATGSRLTDRAAHTRIGEFIGTPEYMSPEQAEKSGLDVDTRSDVYSLGVVLYELLVGTVPFDPSTLRSSGLDEIRRRIREDDPPTPSVRLSQLGAEGQAAGRARHTNANKLAERVRGDLDWICLKALEKDRTRRYGTPTELAEDLNRHLADLPVVARPPSASYRMSKFVRRHRLGVTSALVLVALLMAFAGTMAVQAGRIARERDRANQETQRAEEEARAASEVSRFLVQLFEVSDPGETRGNSITAREILDQGAQRIGGQLASQPAMQARMSRTIGEVYTALGLYKEARPLLENAHALVDSLSTAGKGHPAQLASAKHALALLLIWIGEYEQAHELVSDAVAIRERHSGSDSSELAASLRLLGVTLQRQDRLVDAEVELRRAAEIQEQGAGTNDSEYAATLHNLAIVRMLQKDFAEAETLFLRSADIERTVRGQENHRVATSLHVLSILLQDQERYAEALVQEREALRIREAVLGPDHFHVAYSLTTLAQLHRQLGQAQLALQPGQRAMRIAEEAVGPAHWEAIWMRGDVAKTLMALNKVDEAIATLSTGAQQLENGEDIEGLTSYLNKLGALLLTVGRIEQAKASYDRAARVSETFKQDGTTTPYHGLALVGLAEVAFEERDHAKAADLFRQGIDVMEAAWGSTDPDVQDATARWIEVLRILGRTDETDAADTGGN